MRCSLLLLSIAGLCQLATACQSNKEAPAPDCGTPATVRNLTGLDGCGYVLELATGKRLEPHGEVWQNYPKRDGAVVKISYVSEPSASICMVGEGVRLTCISSVDWCGNAI